jgi:hypothetical protein
VSVRNAKQKKSIRKLSGLALLTRVYEELYVQLGETYSEAQILKAAQTLIDALAEEYNMSEYDRPAIHDGYFSAETDKMIRNHPWLIYERESRLYPGFER